MQDGKEIVSLTGETSADLLVYAYYLAKWAKALCLSHERFVSTVGSSVAQVILEEECADDRSSYHGGEIWFVGGEVDPGLTYEVIISWTRCYVSAQTEVKTRIIALGVSLANA
jgi:pre-mRNA-splicing helicase BRR2